MPSEAEIIRLWLARGVVLLKHHISELNTLNVFPVADADTGTNLYLTFESAQRFELTRSGKSNDLFDALSAIARGALEGARGNSGVIVAEALKGAVEGLDDAEYSLSTLLKHAARNARASVSEPQPGTILDVLDDVANMNSANPREIAEQARRVLLEKRDLLPQLKKAGVVDAGGRGLVILLDALADVCLGVETPSPPVGYVPASFPNNECEADRAFELIFKTSRTDIQALQVQLQPLGTSITTTSDTAMTKVHIHTDAPKEVLERIEVGSKVWDVTLESLQPAQANVGCVAYATGIGNLMHLVALGVTALSDIDHPITEHDLTQAALKSNHASVILVLEPQHLDVAESAIAELREFNVSAEFIASSSVVSTLAAISVFDAFSDVEKNRESMVAAMTGIESFLIESNDFQVLNPERIKSAEVITVVWGDSADVTVKSSLRQYIREYATNIDFIEIQGDQVDSIAIVGLE